METDIGWAESDLALVGVWKNLNFSHVVSSLFVEISHERSKNCLKMYDQEIAKSRKSSFTNIDALLDVKFLVTCVNKMAATRPCEGHLKLLM
jgi:hypothetical protein